MTPHPARRAKLNVLFITRFVTGGTIGRKRKKIVGEWGGSKQKSSRKLVRSKCKIDMYEALIIKPTIFHNEYVLMKDMTNKTIKLQSSRQ